MALLTGKNQVTEQWDPTLWAGVAYPMFRHDPSDTKLKRDDGTDNPGFKVKVNILKEDLFPHQLLAVVWMLRQENTTPWRGGILADEPGLGKVGLLLQHSLTFRLLLTHTLDTHLDISNRHKCRAKLSVGSYSLKDGRPCAETSS